MMVAMSEVKNARRKWRFSRQASVSIHARKGTAAMVGTGGVVGLLESLCNQNNRCCLDIVAHPMQGFLFQ
jgi:hypothetical protein